MKISILDQCPVSKGATYKDAYNATIALAKAADSWGFTRYWLAEHHSMDTLSCPSPEIFLAHLGAVTENIRIGSGGILLPYYKPYKVAENFHLLETLYPARIDLGIGRAPGGSAEVSMALSDNYLQQVNEMPDKIKELQSFLNDRFSPDHPSSKIKAVPIPNDKPSLWLLGTGKKSAKMAAENGTAYVYGHFMSNVNGDEIIKNYREQFTPHNGSKPYVMIAVSVICAETTKQAEELALSQLFWHILVEKEGYSSGIPSIKEAQSYPYTEKDINKMKEHREKMIAGSPSEVKEQLRLLKDTYHADEVMILTITHDYSARAKSYELIAKHLLSEKN
ncbi:LLM class flavin-dependent oxidoreductase [Bacillus tianshenii]|nr:LLM class flavin-dependent oxidoreductase [Bacillus tianshenii]